jgi:hypothetical protein
MVKYMTDSSDFISNITRFEDFENAIRTEHERFENSLAYPGYTGLGAKPATKNQTYINKVATKNKGEGFSLDKDGTPPQNGWLIYHVLHVVNRATLFSIVRVSPSYAILMVVNKNRHQKHTNSI